MYLGEVNISEGNDMLCPTCNLKMLIRNGKFGEFYYCPEQHICKQKTITKLRNTCNLNDSSGLYSLARSGEINSFSQSLHEIHTLAVKEHVD